MELVNLPPSTLTILFSLCPQKTGKWQTLSPRGAEGVGTSETSRYQQFPGSIGLQSGSQAGRSQPPTLPWPTGQAAERAWASIGAALSVPALDSGRQGRPQGARDSNSCLRLGDSIGSLGMQLPSSGLENPAAPRRRAGARAVGSRARGGRPGRGQGRRLQNFDLSLPDLP